MNEPELVIHGTRRLHKDAEYAPSFDGRYLHRVVNRSRLKIIQAAENCHRWVALSTNIGTVRFSLELKATHAFESVIYAKTGNTDWRGIQRRIEQTKNLHDQIRRLSESYEVLDETWSALRARVVLEDKRCREIRSLEESLAEYDNPLISTTYHRMKSIEDKFADPDEGQDWTLWILRLSTQIPFDDYAALFSCDERLEFFLTTAERALKKGLPTSDLEDYLTHSAEKAGYTVGPPGFSRAEFQDYLKGVTETFEDNWMENLLNRYKLIQESLEEDYLEGLQPAKIQNRACRLPRIVLEPLGSLLVMKSRKGDDDISDAWQGQTLMTLMRDAVLYSDSECPGSLISANGKSVICPPQTDKRCLFRSARELFKVFDPLATFRLLEKMNRNSDSIFAADYGKKMSS